MKHFFLITNQIKDPDGVCTDQIISYLEDHGGIISLVKDGLSSIKDISNKEIFKKEISGTEDICAIVLGGDGTLLKAARDLIDSDIPLLGVNLGTLGYLAEVEIGNVEQALDMLLSDEYVIEDRRMLEVCVYPGEQRQDGFALNDIIISRCGSLQVLQFDIYVNGQFLNGYSADGMIVATPTGSTAYNLSAGGPIVEPGASLLLLTPICPHTLNTRSIILSPEDEITIEIPEGRDHGIQSMEANFDGAHKVLLQTGDKIVIRKAGKTTGILKLRTESFLETLHKKMTD